MFGNITQVLFPNECRVLEITPGSLYVYPIFKNGSTSLFKEQYRELTLSEVSSLEIVDVFVRAPQDRFISGVQKFLAGLEPELDQHTALYFAKNYLFLNRHYMPQFMWLINFCRFSNAKFNIRPMADLSSITNYHEHPPTVNIDDAAVEYLLSDSKANFYLEMDEVLTVNYINQTVSMEQLLSTLKTNYPEIYQEAVQPVLDIVNVVSKT